MICSTCATAACVVPATITAGCGSCPAVPPTVYRSFPCDQGCSNLGPCKTLYEIVTASDLCECTYSLLWCFGADWRQVLRVRRRRRRRRRWGRSLRTRRRRRRRRVGQAVHAAAARLLVPRPALLVRPGGHRFACGKGHTILYNLPTEPQLEGCCRRVVRSLGSGVWTGLWWKVGPATAPAVCCARGRASCCLPAAWFF